MAVYFLFNSFYFSLFFDFFTFVLTFGHMKHPFVDSNKMIWMLFFHDDVDAPLCKKYTITSMPEIASVIP